jgi:predicted Zn-dependent peptidase
MTKLHKIVALLAVLVTVVAGVAPASAEKPWEEIDIPELNEFEMPEFERVELDNGMVLYLAEDDFVPMLQLSATIRAGSIYEPADKVGLASMTGTVLRTGGAGERSGDQIDALVEARGMSVETWVGQTTGGAYLSCLNEDVDLGLGLLADILMRPRFAEEKIALARQEQKSAISRRNDEPMSIAQREVRKVLYGEDHPLARHPEYDTIEAVTRQDMQAFHQAYFHPEHMYLVVIGDFEADQMVERIEAAFAGWEPAPAPLPEDPEIPDLPRTVNVAAKDGLTQATVLLGHKGIRNDHPDYAAVRVGAEILGGGFNSRLFKEIRSNRGLAYAVGASSGTGWRFPGTFMAYTMTKNSTVQEAAEAILAEIERMLAEPVSEEELQFAKDMILNSEVFNYDTKREVLDRLVLFEMYGYQPDFLQRYQEAVKELTPADIHAAVQDVWHPERLSFLVVGTPEEFDGDMSVFGPVNEIDITIPAPTPKLEIPAATPESLARGKDLMQQLRARTGGDAFDGLQAYHQTTVMTAQTPMGEMDITMDQTVQLPHHMRLVTKLPFGEQVQVLAGEEGWAKSPRGEQEMTADQVAATREQIQQDTLSILRRVDELEFQALEPMPVDGTPCIPVVVRFGEEPTVMFLDQETGLLKMVQSQGQDPMSGSPVTEKVHIREYQEMDGFKLPKSLTIEHDDEEFAQVTVTAFEANPEVDPALFQR